MLGLRSAAGVAEPPGFADSIERLAAAGLVERAGGRVWPTDSGLNLHNQIALEVL